MNEHLFHMAVLVLQLFIDTMSESYYAQWIGSEWWRLSSKISSEISSWDLLGRLKLHIQCFQCCSWDMFPLIPCLCCNCCTERNGWLHRYFICLWLKSVSLKTWVQTRGIYRKMWTDCIWNAVGPFKIVQPFSYLADLRMV
jgi:hypothetical protein